MVWRGWSGAQKPGAGVHFSILVLRGWSILLDHGKWEVVKHAI